jgi:hypothetical protein
MQTSIITTESKLSFLVPSFDAAFKSYSSLYLSPTITLSETNHIAHQTSSNSGRFVFTNIRATPLVQRVVFRVKGLKNWVGLGVGIRSKLKFINYRFERKWLLTVDTAIGHGSYLLSSNGFAWSHS